MTKFNWAKRPLLTGLALALAVPVSAQNTDTSGDVRLRKLEAEVAALQRQVFPGGDGKYFAPLVQPGQSAAATPGTPATTPVTDLLARMDAVEAQLARITAQNEETQNKLSQLEAKLAALSAPTTVPATTPGAGAPAAATAAPAATTVGATTSTNLSAMTGGASAPKPATAQPATTKPAAAAPTKPAAASADRVAAVKAVEKPVTADAGDDDYSYGFRLWEAKFYPEAQQQLQIYVDRYPKHNMISFGRNLLGRAWLDDGKPGTAAQFFLQNYLADKKGARAPDSLLFLGIAMVKLKDTEKACGAFAELASTYPDEIAGRLKGQYDAARGSVKCK